MNCNPVLSKKKKIFCEHFARKEEKQESRRTARVALFEPTSRRSIDFSTVCYIEYAQQYSPCGVTPTHITLAQVLHYKKDIHSAALIQLQPVAWRVYAARVQEG